MKKVQYALIGGICCVGVGATVLTLSSSFWFLSALAENIPRDYSFGYQQSVSSRYPSALKTLEEKNPLPSDIRNHYSSLVYLRSGDAEYVIGTPKLLRQFSIQRELEGNSWVAKRMGWIVLASKTNAEGGEKVAYSTFLAGLKTTLRSVGIARLPIRPLFVFQAQSFSLYGARQQGGVHLVINKGSSEFLARQQSRMATTKPEDKKWSYVSLQSDVLENTFPEFSDTIEQEIAESFRFQKTHPRIVQELLSFGPVAIGIGTDRIAAIGVKSTENAPAALITQWMAAEQGNRHPAKRAFSLPDKTLAYEYIPGRSSAYFALNKGNSSCLPSEDYDEKIFLCARDAFVVMAIDEEAGSRLLSFMENTKGSWKGIIQQAVLEKLGLSKDFEHIEYAGSEDRIEVWADRKKEER